MLLWDGVRYRGQAGTADDLAQQPEHRAARGLRHVQEGSLDLISGQMEGVGGALVDEQLPLPAVQVTEGERGPGRERHARAAVLTVQPLRRQNDLEA